jgi:DNA-directed RNA polymerase subunit RPC12/RpoP
MIYYVLLRYIIFLTLSEVNYTTFLRESQMKKFKLLTMQKYICWNCENQLYLEQVATTRDGLPCLKCGGHAIMPIHPPEVITKKVEVDDTDDDDNSPDNTESV